MRAARLPRGERETKAVAMTAQAQREAAVSPERILEQTPERTIAGLSGAIAGLIRSGELAPDTRLPTVRELARVGGMSVRAVLAAWSELREQGLVATQRRGGTVVLAPHDDGFAGWEQIDFGRTGIDAHLQPSMRDALLAGLDSENLHAVGREAMTEPLRDAVAGSWPFAPEAWMTASGGAEALVLAIEAVAPAGSAVAVDEPLAPGVLDTIRVLGLTAVGVASDDDGPLPEALAAALDAGAAAFVLQPGAPFAVRHALTEERAAQLADVVAAHEGAWVIEDDAVGPLEPSPTPSLGERLPGRVLRIRSYCKAYGTDLRTSVLGGPTELIERAQALRSHGAGSTSRILQNALAHLLTSEDAAAVVRAARARYDAARRALLEALAERGVRAASGPRSLVVWVEAPDEMGALLALARRGIVVGASSRSFASALDRPMLRVSVTQLPPSPELIADLADRIADSVSADSREFFD